MPPTPFIPNKPRVHRKRRQTAMTPSAPAALNLVAAEFFFDAEGSLLLTFDRPINLAGLNLGQITVIDGSDTLLAYVAVGVDDTPTPESVMLLLSETGAAGAGPVVLNATNGTGIVAVDDGGAWAGATGLGLPFP